MKAIRINSEKVFDLVSNVKSVYRLGGFETGKRTDLTKAASFCFSDYAELNEGVDMALVDTNNVYVKEYQTEVRTSFKNEAGETYEIWFEKDFKVYMLQMNETTYLIVAALGYCNVYRLIEKDENEKFEDQPAITYNGDSKETSIQYEGETIRIKTTLSNTKVCKWDVKYPEDHNHYTVKVSYSGKSLSFDFFDSEYNYSNGITDKSRIEVIEMFQMFISDCILGGYTFEMFECETGGTEAQYKACKTFLKKFERVFEGVDKTDLYNYIQEHYEVF